MRLSGYTNRLSVRGGEIIEARVSSFHEEDFSADLVRIYSADPNPAGPGIDLRHVPSSIEGRYRSVAKQSRPGSYALLPLETITAGDVTFSIRFQPRLHRESAQTIASFVTADARALRLDLESNGVAVLFEGFAVRADFRVELRRWYELRLAWTADRLTLACFSVETGSRLSSGSLVLCLPVFVELVLAARRNADRNAMGCFFNGRLEAPSLLSGAAIPESLDPVPCEEDRVLARWDFSEGISGDLVKDVGPAGLDGRLINLPTRGVRGSKWSGRERSWTHAPLEYAAIHFHEGDLYDCGWDTDFAFAVPEDLPSGVYGFRLRCEGSEDIVPFFVRPPASGPTARVAVLFSTLTYLAYGNYPRTNYDAAYVARSAAWRSYPHHPALYPEFGRSLYDVHADGSGVMFSSMLRPQLLMRPGFFAYLDERGSGLRHFPADMHLIAWLAAKGIDADVVTDHDLDAEGRAALDGYAVVLTVTHPEYHTLATLDALQGFVNGGGNLAYLGGNGFYWRVATSSQYPGAIEMRRGESGVRMWEAEPGECHHAFDGQYGGLWLKNDRPPQRLVGVGMSAQGAYTASYYRRSEASRMPEYRWLFAGIDDEILGDFGLSGGGAAGFELDVVDPELGTPGSTIVLAVSERHPADYACVPEKTWNPDLHTPEWQKSQIRADLALVPLPKGNHVFSAGSIMFCGSLPVTGFDNNISRLLRNFVLNGLREPHSE